MKGAEARGKQGEDILKLKTESTVFREGLATADSSLRSLTAASSSHTRKLETAASEGIQTAAHIRNLQEQTNKLLNTVRCFSPPPAIVLLPARNAALEHVILRGSRILDHIEP